MTRSLDRTRFEIAMRQDRIARIGFERSPRRAAARDRFAVSVFGAAFCDQQIVITVDFVEVRTFRTASAGAIPEWLDLRKSFAGLDIDF